MSNGWQVPGFAALDYKCPDDPARESALLEFRVLDAGLYDDDGPIMVVDGVGHDEARLLAFATVDDAHGGWWISPTSDRHAVLSIDADTWAWSPRVKNCEPYTAGWGCDQSGDWHRHLVANNGGKALTLIRLMAWAPGSGPAVTYEQWWNDTHPGIPFRRQAAS